MCSHLSLRAQNLSEVSGLHVFFCNSVYCLPHPSVYACACLPTTAHAPSLSSHFDATLAVNSYWDTVLRFQHENLPAEFYHDFLSVVDDEARHFGKHIQPSFFQLSISDWEKSLPSLVLCSTRICVSHTYILMYQLRTMSMHSPCIRLCVYPFICVSRHGFPPLAGAAVRLWCHALL